MDQQGLISKYSDAQESVVVGPGESLLHIFLQLLTNLGSESRPHSDLRFSSLFACDLSFIVRQRCYFNNDSNNIWVSAITISAEVPFDCEVGVQGLLIPDANTWGCVSEF